MPVRWLSLTDEVIDCGRGAHASVVRKLLASSNIIQKFQNTTWGKKVAARQAKKTLTDFDRFRVMVAKKRTGIKIRTEINKLAKVSQKK